MLFNETAVCSRKFVGFNSSYGRVQIKREAMWKIKKFNGQLKRNDLTMILRWIPLFAPFHYEKLWRFGMQDVDDLLAVS